MTRMAQPEGIAVALRARVKELEREIESLHRIARAESARHQAEVATLRLAVKAMEEAGGFCILCAIRRGPVTVPDVQSPEGRDANGSPVG